MHELINGTSLGDPLLMDETAYSNHSQSAVHNFIGLVLLERGGVFAQAQRIEPKITRFGLSLDSLLQPVAADTLKQDNEHQNLTHATRLDVEVVSIDGQHLRKVAAAKCEQFLDNHAESGEHTNAAVLDLGSLQEADVDVVRDEKGVKFVGGGETV